MRKRLIGAMCLSALLLTGCVEADRVGYNITQEADNFNIYRRVVAINCIKGDVIFEMEGFMSINADTDDKQLEIIVETGPNKYQKHFIGLSDNVCYTVEDLSGEDVDRYHYELNFNPKLWLPYTVKHVD